MSESQTLNTVLSSLISILGLWYLLFWLYRDYRTDVFRQELFALRDTLFDLGSAELIDFAHPAYGMLRSTLNGFIRFAHRLTLLQAFLFLLFSWKNTLETDDRFEYRWDMVATDLSPILRERLDEIIQRMHTIVLKYLVLSSPILVLSTLTIIVPIMLWIAGHFFMGRLVNSLRKPLTRIDMVAVAFGA